MLKDEIQKYLNEQSKPDVVVVKSVKGKKTDSAKNIKNKGTFFFIYIDPANEFDITKYYPRDVIRDQLEAAMLTRILRAFISQCEPIVKVDEISERFNVRVRLERNEGYDNGEVYLWVSGNWFKEEFALKILMELKNMLDKHPLKIQLASGEEESVKFSGWGFGYI